MIRTRDFLLYVIIFVCILMGISLTLAHNDRSDTASVTTPTLQTAVGTELDITQNSDDIDRAHNISALREKLAKGEGEIIQGAPVFTSVDTPTSTTAPDPTTENPDVALDPSDRIVQMCVFPTSSQRIENLWPSNGILIQTIEGARIVSGPVTTEIMVGSSTVATTSEQMLAQLSVTPVRSFTPSCLDSKIVGIALDGSLITNDETWRFRNASSESVIGYALDGHPILGQGVDETRLDACGGYDTGAGYQYHLRETELFILGCYAASPATLLP